MALRFEWNSEKAAANIEKHGVSFDEAKTVFGDPLGRITDDPRHSIGEHRFVLMGMSEKTLRLTVMFTERAGTIRIISARRATSREWKIMKRPRKSKTANAQIEQDEILSDYDFTKARPNTYAARYRKGALVVTLDAEVAEVFPTAEDVNKTLRSIARIIRARRERQSTHK